MSALHASHPEDHGDRRQPDPLLVVIDRWAQLAVERPWRYVATWAIGIGAANLGLRMLLNDLSLARNAGLAILTAVGFLVFAWVYTAQLTRPLRRHRPRPVENPAVPKQSGGRPPAQSPPRRRRLVLATVAVIAITLALLVGAVTSRSAAPEGGHDVVVPSWRD
jgi:alkylation response protein AidB-like acyl-CoA dehydrogenase